VIVTQTANKDKALKPARAPKAQTTGLTNAAADGPAGPWTFARDVPEKGPCHIDFQLP
jgi:hypothetical protein